MFCNTELTAERKRLKKFAMRLTGNPADADDLLQSALLRAMEKKHLYKEGTNLYAWISKIMYNLFVSGYRRKVKFESQYDPDPHIQNEKVDAGQNVKMEVHEVNDAMNELSKDHQKIIDMVCVRGMRYETVANKLDLPIGTVRSRLSRARENLKENLEKPSNDVQPFKAGEISEQSLAGAR